MMKKLLTLTLIFLTLSNDISLGCGIIRRLRSNSCCTNTRIRILPRNRRVVPCNDVTQQKVVVVQEVAQAPIIVNESPVHPSAISESPVHPSTISEIDIQPHSTQSLGTPQPIDPRLFQKEVAPAPKKFILPQSEEISPPKPKPRLDSQSSAPKADCSWLKLVSVTPVDAKLTIIKDRTVRLWSDISGKHTVRGVLDRSHAHWVRIQKDNGKFCIIPTKFLSVNDKEYALQFLDKCTEQETQVAVMIWKSKNTYVDKSSINLVAFN